MPCWNIPQTDSLQRFGRKSLLGVSAGGALLSLLGVGYGLNSGMITLASVAILTFVAYVLHHYVFASFCLSHLVPTVHSL